MGQKWTPGATWTRQGTQNVARNTVQPRRALGTRQDTQQHVTQGQSFSKSRSTKANATAKTTRRARRLPCLRAGDHRFCAPQTRQGGTETLRRALWHPRRPDIYHTPCDQDAGIARTHGFHETAPASLDCWEHRQRGWHGRARSCRLALARPRSSSQTAQMSRRCLAEPTRTMQCVMQVTAKLAERLAARIKGGARCSRTTSLQVASAKS